MVLVKRKGKSEGRGHGLDRCSPSSDSSQQTARSLLILLLPCTPDWFLVTMRGQTQILSLGVHEVRFSRQTRSVAAKFLFSKMKCTLASFARASNIKTMFTHQAADYCCFDAAGRCSATWNFVFEWVTID